MTVADWRLTCAGRYDTYPKVKSAIRDNAEQMRHKSDPMEVDEMAHAADEEYDGE